MPLSLAILQAERPTTHRALTPEEQGAMEQALGLAEQMAKKPIARLAGEPYDVVILDLMLPSMGGDPSPEASRSIVQRIHSGMVAGTPVVFGLTAHEDVRDAELSFFSANMLNVLLFSWNDEEWAKILVGRIEYLMSDRGLGGFKIGERFQSDLCVIVARHHSEYLPIKQQMKWFGETFEGHALFPQHEVVRGVVEIGPQQRKLATLICIGEKGLAPAAAVTSVALLAFRPKLIAMLGMCCGFNPNWPQCGLGDMVVAREAESWDSGRYEEVVGKSEFFPEPRTIVARFGAAGSVAQIIERRGEVAADELGKVWRRGSTQRAIPDAYRTPRRTPVLRTGQLVSGLSIVDSIEKREEVARRFPGACALDMEVYGFYDACARSALRNTDYIAIKGVADFGDGKKVGGEFDQLQPIISAMSWMTLVSLCREA